MNLASIDKIAKAVLYEGYMLYPYRPSSVKNRPRWNFGVLYPQAYSAAQEGTDAWSMQTECLVEGNAQTMLECRVRFLQLRTRSAKEISQSMSPSLPDDWQEGVEREAILLPLSLGSICWDAATHCFSFPIEGAGDREPLHAEFEVTGDQRGEELFKVRLRVRNVTPVDCAAVMTRDQALKLSLVSCHAVLGVEKGEFVSLLEPPANRQDAAAACENVGAWPVLVGEQGQRDTLLASPIILYDYPQIAPESAGDLFDGTEIDEILSLRILTLTDDEKREIRQSDDRAQQILERTENLPAEQFMKLHGAVRGMRPLGESES